MYEAKKLPVDRAQSFSIFRAMIANYSEEVVEIDEKVRADLGIIEHVGFEPILDEETEEEQKARLDGVVARKAEAYKKIKGKPKTEEEEAADVQQVSEKATEILGEALCANEERLTSAEGEVGKIKTRWLMQNHLKMDHDRWDIINRKLSIYDIELGSKDIILRLDLDVPMSPFIVPPKIEEKASVTGKSFA